MRNLGLIAALTLVLFTTSAFAQNESIYTPTVEECTESHERRELCPAPPAPPKRPAKRRHAKRRRAESGPVITGIDITTSVIQPPAPTTPPLTREEVWNIIRQEAASRPAPLPVSASDTRPIVNVDNHVHVKAPPQSSPAKQAKRSQRRFVLELGGGAAVRIPSDEVAPGVRVAARLKINHLVLGLQAGYERLAFEDGSTVEDFAAEPTIGWEFGKSDLRPFVSGGVGIWTSLEDWITPTCGRDSCPGGTTTSLSFVAEGGVLLQITNEVSFTVSLPLRLIPWTRDGGQLNLGVNAGIGVATP